MINKYKITEEGILISIKVIPNSSKNEFIKTETEIKLKITVPPIENKANKFIIEYLSKIYKIAKTNIQIIKGLTSKEKTILIKTQDEILKGKIQDFFTI